jgi:hypothetical protein
VKEEGRGKKEEGRRKREEGRGKKEEGRGKKQYSGQFWNRDASDRPQKSQ